MTDSSRREPPPLPYLVEGHGVETAALPIHREPPPVPERLFDTPPPIPHDYFARRRTERFDCVETPLPTTRIGTIRRTWQAIAAGTEWLFGAVAMMAGLAVLAAIPVLQFLSLGYLLEAGGRVARTGRIRDGFIGIRLAARLGGIVLASWLLILPIRFLSDMARAATVIDPHGAKAESWRMGLIALALAILLHVGLACARGGKLRYFLWPFNFIWLIRQVFRGGYYAKARDAVWDTMVSLRLPYYFWLGFRGFIAVVAWLAVPVTLLALGHGKGDAAVVVGILGGVLLGIVLLYLPFLQMRMAATNRFYAAFEVRAVRADFRRAPWAFASALFITLLFALPLYLLKIEIVPRDAAWLPGLVFIAFIFPARILTGWALARASRRKKPRHWFFRWTGRLPLIPAVAIYVTIVFFTQYTSWNGVWSLYEQHAFMLPVPFFGM